MYNFSSKDGNSSHHLKTDGFSCQKIYKKLQKATEQACRKKRYTTGLLAGIEKSVILIAEGEKTL